MTPDERIDRIRGDHWIAFDRATIVLNRLTSLMEMPQQSRMPGLMVYGSSGIGKTMIAKRMASKYPTQYNAQLGATKTPILLVQAPPAPDERRFYQHILATIGAPMWGRHTVSELEVRALSVPRAARPGATLECVEAVGGRWRRGARRRRERR